MFTKKVGLYHIDTKDDFTIIRFSNKKDILIDNDIFDIIKDSKIHINKYGYAYIGKYRFLHQITLGKSVNKEKTSIDHINHNLLDNRRDNLRHCTHAENMRNRKIQKNNKTGYPGVVKNGFNWGAKIKKNNKWFWLGTFTTKEEAIAAKKKANEDFFGEFAPDI
ncbi:MAG: HNH endonuclease [Methanobrevibacter sp.]|jgi:hypothetical protein|nr:HNH endonuclease [Methanobrevibacter sp.]